MPEPGWFLLTGANLGYAMHPRDSNGFLLGAEMSAVHFVGAWYGAYADVLGDFGAGVPRVSVGPEVGAGPLGIDAGFLAVFRSDRTDEGFCIRGLLTIGVIGLYGRWAHLLSKGTPEPSFGEIGVLLKYPFELSKDEFEPRRPQPEEGPVPPPPPPAPPEGGTEPGGPVMPVAK